MMLLKKKAGQLDFYHFAKILRSHIGSEKWEPSRGSMKDVCMHAGGLTRPSQTAGSYIGELHKKAAIHWFTATSVPCLSAYKPVFIEAGLPELGAKPNGRFNPEALWWRHERFHRKILCSYRYHAQEVRRKMEKLEEELVEEVKKLRRLYLSKKADKEDLFRLTSEAFAKAEEILDENYSEARKGLCLNPFFAYYWWKINRQAGMTL